MLRIAGPLLVVLLAAACGKNEPSSPGDAGAVDAPAADVGGDVLEDEGPTFVCPKEGELLCGDRCIDVTISMDHCGACDNACIRGTMTCNGQECVCLGNGIMCDGRCFDPQSTRLHCGDCETACPSSDACVAGTCVEISTRPEVVGVLEATNAARMQQQDCGVEGIRPAVGPVQLNDALMRAAQGHAEDMVANPSLKHEGSNGSSPGDRARSQGYSGLTGENVARGYDTPEAVVAGWIDSDGHCRNLTDGDFVDLGVGFAVNPSDGAESWVQLFGQPL